MARRKGSERIELSCTLLVETTDAWRLDFGDKVCWIPKSQADLEEVGDNIYECSLPEWLATEKGLV